LASEEVNLMEILGVANRELQHSNFLAWLFNPNESHGLGDLAIKEFIKLYYRENEFQDLGRQTPLSVFDFVNLDFKDLEIRREYKNIDLILLSQANGFCIVIENKIYARESKNQLKKYRNQIESEYSELKHKIFIFLSLEEQDISNEERDYYVSITYSHIVKLLSQVLQRRGLTEKNRFVFEQYLQTLRSMLNQNEEIERIAQSLYQKYKSAFDLVLKYSVLPSNAVEQGALESLVRSDSRLHSNRNFKVFQPQFLYRWSGYLQQAGFLPVGEEVANTKLFYFEFKFRSKRISLEFRIGPGESQIRRNLYQMFLAHPDVFNSVSKRSLSPDWHLAYRKDFVTANEYDKYSDDDDTLSVLIEKRFNEFVNIDLVRIESVFKEELTSRGQNVT
jgi:hypothetical protein